MRTLYHIISFAALVVAIVSGCNNAKNESLKSKSTDSTYTINGRINGFDSGQIYLIHYFSPALDKKKDSATVVNGKFTFKGHVDSSGVFVLGLASRDTAGNITSSFIYEGPFILQEGNLRIEGSIDSMRQLRVWGTKGQNQYNEFKAILNPLLNERKIASDAVYMATKNKSYDLDSLEAVHKNTGTQIMEAIKAHIKKYPSSTVSAFIIKSSIASLNAESLTAAYNYLTPKAKSSFYGRQLSEAVKAGGRTAIGGPAPQFTLPNIKGENVSSKSLRGKYVLLDFWASWCGPCRAENPSLKKIYSKYKSRGFEIVGISMDTYRTNWLTAVREDQLEWAQLSDLKGMKSEIRNDFGILSLPRNFLLDRNGNVIARDLKPDDLKKKLDQTL